VDREKNIFSIEITGGGEAEPEKQWGGYGDLSCELRIGTGRVGISNTKE